MNQTEQRAQWLAQLVSDWYECLPYAEQVPTDLSERMKKFADLYSGMSDTQIYDAFCEAEPDSVILGLFECIFELGASYAIHQMANAVFDRDAKALALIDLQPVGESVFVDINKG